MDVVPADSIELRDLWDSEILFSVWLAQHPELIENALGIEIDRESIRTEQSVGSFRVDLYAMATSPDDDDLHPLVVECQLEATNHKHLGQLLTYAIGRDAPMAAWVVSEARPEHTRVAQWINDHTPLRMWLLELETVRVGDSVSGALLRPVSQPSDATRTATHEPDTSPRAEARRAWWATVLERAPNVLGPGHPWSGRSPTNTPTLKVSAPRNAYWHLTVGEHFSRCYLRVGATEELTSEQVLQRLRDEVAKRAEGDIRSRLQWNPSPGARTSTVGLETPVEAGYGDENEWDEAADALLRNAERLVGALGPMWESLNLSSTDNA